MKSSFCNGTVRIDITTYDNENAHSTRKMERQHNCTNNQNSKFICSICLKTKPKTDEQDLKKKSRPCKICKQVCEFKVSTDEKRKEKVDSKNIDDISTKNIQTSRTDVSQGLNLLNEVLTVFQSKKQHESQKEKTRTVLLKDASVSTDEPSINILRPKLTLSKIFQLSIEETNTVSNGKFSVVNSCEPKHSHHSPELIKRKSSSIPQMKLEELKHSLKEKVKPKDTIEEVNRLFATVKRDKCDGNNRPKVRSGPRVLPVVKTDTYTAPKSNESLLLQTDTKPICKYCDANYHLSSGDNLAKQESNDKSIDRTEKSVYLMCCRYKNHKRDLQTDCVICERCKVGRIGRYEEDCPCFLEIENV